MSITKTRFASVMSSTLVLAATSDKNTKIVLEAIQELLLKPVLQAARDDYEARRERQRQGIEDAKRDGRVKGRPADGKTNAKIIKLRKDGKTIAETADLLDCSTTHVKRIWRAHQAAAQHQPQ